jgi:hypothetical protein
MRSAGWSHVFLPFLYRHSSGFYRLTCNVAALGGDITEALFVRDVLCD